MSEEPDLPNDHSEAQNLERLRVTHYRVASLTANASAPQHPGRGGQFAPTTVTFCSVSMTVSTQGSSVPHRPVRPTPVDALARLQVEYGDSTRAAHEIQAWCNRSRALEELCKRYQERIRIWVRQVIRDSDDDLVDELAQKTWERIISRINSFDRTRGHGFFAWVATITRSIAISELRDRVRHARGTGGEGSERMADLPDLGEDPFEKVASEIDLEHERVLYAAAKAMVARSVSAKAMRAYELRYEADPPGKVAEIAAILQLSTAQVSTLANRVYEKIEVVAQQYMQEGLPPEEAKP